MTTFDSFLFGSGALSIIIFFLTNTIRKKKNKNNKLFIITSTIIICLFIITMLFFAYHFNWESDILGLHTTSEEFTEASNLYSKETKSDETTDNIHELEPQVQENLFETIFSDVSETHTPDDSITASVSFRLWDATTDSDLRNDSHLNTNSYFVSYSNLFNSIGGGGSDSSKIISDIHFSLSDNKNLNKSNLFFSGAIVATMNTQESEAYADVSILVDNVEKWRSNNSIMGNTVQPVKFKISIENIKKDVTIRIACVPKDNGLALGLIDLDVIQDYYASTSTTNAEISKDVDLFSRAFESHTPKDDAVYQVSFNNWDTFSNADLRGEQYADNSTIFIKISNTFNILGSNSSSPIVSDIHLTINPKKDTESLSLSGLIVAEKSTQGSTAYADISILVDGVEKWRSDNSINGNTVAPVDFRVDLSGAKYEVVFRISCMPLDNGLALGLVGMKEVYE